MPCSPCFFLLPMSCLTETGSSTWPGPLTTVMFPSTAGPCHWGCEEDWRWCFVRPVLPKIQPMSCDDDFMPIIPPFCESCCWELCSKTGLLMMVIFTQLVAINTTSPFFHRSVLTSFFWWKIAKNYFKCVFKVILLVSECRSLCKNFWDQIPRHEFWTWRKSPLFNFVHRTSKSFPAAHCP